MKSLVGVEAIGLPPGQHRLKNAHAAPSLTRWLLAAALAAAATAASYGGLPELEPRARWALLIFAGAIIAWTTLDMDETPVALAGALALLAAGATSMQKFYAGLGDDFIWLLIGAFMLAAVVQASGLAQRWALQLVAGSATPAVLMRRLTWFILATALVIPSTSGRAALLVPVFLALSQALTQARQVRALALLFPTVILLSACVSMLGAGAHLVALDFIQRLGGDVPSFLGWLWLAGPFGVASSLLACELIARLFLRPEERLAPITLPAPELSPLTRHQRSIIAIMAATLLAWTTSGWHGVEAPIIAVCGALLATMKVLTGSDMKSTLKKVEWNLIIFMAATMIMGEALVDSGAASALAQALLQAVPIDRIPPLMSLALAVLLALLSHLLVTSRTARVTVLIPAVALPLAAAGHNPVLLVFIMAIASGFCQTLVVSAKPVAMFSQTDTGNFSARDLALLSLALLPGMFLLILLFACCFWPAMGLL